MESTEKLNLPRRDTRDYRSRYFATLLVDGRCFHDASHDLVEFEEHESNVGLPHESRVLNTDHVIPRATGGADRLDNYVGSCKTCNESRQDKPLTDLDNKRLNHLRLRIDYAEIDKMAAKIDQYREKLAIDAVRCSKHEWHLKGSPAHRECEDFWRSKMGYAKYPRLREWAIAFGDISGVCLDRLKGTKLWDEYENHEALLVAIPRSLSGDLLSRDRSDADRIDRFTQQLEGWTSLSDIQASALPRITFYPIANLRLSTTTSTRKISAGIQSNIQELSQLIEERMGIEWRVMADLLVRNDWPDYIAFDGSRPNFFRSISNNQRRQIMTDLKLAKTVSEADQIINRELMKWIKRNKRDND